MSAAAIERADRERRAMALRQSGATFEEIAAELGLANRGAAHKLVRRGLTRWMHESDEELRALELERTETIIGRLWPLIDRGDPNLKALETYLRVAEYRAKLAGLFAPKKAVVGIQVGGEVRHLAKLDALRELDTIIEARVTAASTEQGDDDDFSA
jgi:hypothetical protein